MNTETRIIYPARNTASFENAIGEADGGLTTEVHRNLRFYDILESIKVGESLKRVSYGYCPPGPYESFTTYDNAETEIFGYTLAAHRATPMLEPGVAVLYDETGCAALCRLVARIDKNRDIFYKTQLVKELCVMQNNHPRTDRDLAHRMLCPADPLGLDGLPLRFPHAFAGRGALPSVSLLPDLLASDRRRTAYPCGA